MESHKTNDQKPLGAAYLSAIFKTTRAFMYWARREYPVRYKKIDSTWVDSLRPTRLRSEQAFLKTREIYTLEEVRKLVDFPASTTAEKRIRAAAAFLFLSGMRIGAFLTMPIKCVDLDQWLVRQLPEMGVHTKNSKAAITYLLNIPELRLVVSEWDNFIRGSLSEDALWYTYLDPWGYLTNKTQRAEYSRVDFRRYLIGLCEKAQVAYKSPHKFRHGHAVYALKLAKTIPQVKAISQNLMHSNMGITDGIYGRLVNDDVKDFIQGLS